MLQLPPSESEAVIRKGGVIAYPTEAVYGLGCDPDNTAALQQLLAIKQRPWQKGLILVAADIGQLSGYVDFAQLSAEQLALVNSKWPGPVTFVMPTFSHISPLLRGEFDSIAVRVSAHPVVQQLCHTLAKPLVSTSANLAGEPSAVSADEILTRFSGQIDALILGELGQQRQPSTIIDVQSGQVLRQG
ncbi:threonylcarbamoyl-AMP synthase [Shewanella sp. NFH-SH190041]|uniref:L-threonylcarbamoyladenylate synthase n=1 Tax=Shewanella sp. NFH-SH190041 TaxID=2950245 RepID=UPI0021C38FE9|nr:L-threonylcarbamoyladenylate synthase [Shewanella sp. NFH-SH190041]BDM62575.1 threonylcarbamoyl-AMP synthase [Shewanella sp. NFH-SH190041]